MKNFKIFTLLTCFFLLLKAFTANTQQVYDKDNDLTLKAVGAEFSGEWFFYKAQSRERLMGSQQNYSVRSVSRDEFWQKVYFLNIPTEVMFDGFFSIISHPSWSKHVVSVINFGKLEFRIYQEKPDDYDKKPDLNEIDSYQTIMPIYDIALNGEVMSLQTGYFYSDGQGSYTEGIITIYYKQ
jgi:hypothetical protein